jgi:hypothetical protein
MKINTRKPDSHPAGFSNGEPGNVPQHPLDDVVANPQTGSILEMQTGLFHLGRNRALQSGTTQPRPDDIRSLEDHARAMAKDTYRDRYDPAQNVHDAMHQAEYEKNLARREEAEETEQHAAANLRDAEARLALAPKAGPKPVAHPLLVAAFIVAITLTVAPTLHDSVFHTLPDDLLTWFFALLSAAFVGGMLTLAILHCRRTRWTWIGVAAGVILGIGLGAVRLSSAEGAGEAMFAVGLTLMEIAAVWLLEWLASGLRTNEAEWMERRNAETEALSYRDAAQVDFTRRQVRVKELTQAIVNTISFVENRHNRNIHIAELEAVAIKAVLDGYNAGIAENIGRIRGVNWRSE